MTLKEDREFRAFVEGRQRLNEQLDRLKAQVDRWLDQHSDGDTTMMEIANLAGLLQQRRDLLSELAALDDTFVTYLLQNRASPSD